RLQLFHERHHLFERRRLEARGDLAEGATLLQAPHDGQRARVEEEAALGSEQDPALTHAVVPQPHRARQPRRQGFAAATQSRRCHKISVFLTSAATQRSCSSWLRACSTTKPIASLASRPARGTRERK